jgi:hypothetical protein
LRAEASQHTEDGTVMCGIAKTQNKHFNYAKKFIIKRHVFNHKIALVTNKTYTGNSSNIMDGLIGEARVKFCKKQLMTQGQQKCCCPVHFMNMY